MVVDCSYGQLYVIDEAPPPGGDDIPEDAVRRALTWLIDHCEEGNEILKVNFLNLTTVDFTSLATACPELAPLKRTCMDSGCCWRCVNTNYEMPTMSLP